MRTRGGGTQVNGTRSHVRGWSELDEVPLLEGTVVFAMFYEMIVPRAVNRQAIIDKYQVRRCLKECRPQDDIEKNAEVR